MTAFTRQQAHALGVSDGRLRGPEFRQLLHGVYAHRQTELTLHTWVEAARLVLPSDVVVTGLTALQLRGLDYGSTFPLHLVTAGRTRTERSGIRLGRRNPLPTGPVASTMEAFHEVCRSAGLLEAVSAGDRMLYRRLCRPEDFRSLSSSTFGAVRLAASLVRLGSESPRETAMRLIVVLAGLPEPKLNPTIRDEAGTIGRIDMHYDEYRTVIEYEGDQHRERNQWGKDIDRVDRMRRLGLEVIRVTAGHLLDPWSQVLRVDEALRRQGYRGRRPRQNGRWMASFGGDASTRIMW